MVYKVKPDVIIEELNKELQDMEEMEVPEWAEYVKTGANREKAPQQDDWWHRRAASLMRKLYIESPRGVRSLSREYGGRNSERVRPHSSTGSSKKVIRTILQQLEDADLVEKSDAGRSLSSEGRSFVDRLSQDLRVEA